MLENLRKAGKNDVTPEDLSERTPNKRVLGRHSDRAGKKLSEQRSRGSADAGEYLNNHTGSLCLQKRAGSKLRKGNASSRSKTRRGRSRKQTERRANVSFVAAGKAKKVKHCEAETALREARGDVRAKA